MKMPIRSLAVSIRRLVALNPAKFILPVVILLLAPALCEANAIFTLGNNPQPGEENVLLNNGTTGNTVQGTTNQTGTPVYFSSTQTLTEPLTGQARIEATSGGNQVGLTNVFFDLAGGLTFTDTIFDMSLGTTVGVAGGTAKIEVVTNDGSFVFAMTLGNGDNFLTITTSGGETLQNVGISYDNSGGFTDLRAIRISGIPGPAPGGSVPDAGTTLMLLPLGLAAMLGLKRVIDQRSLFA
jgi:hypothetical protein